MLVLGTLLVGMIVPYSYRWHTYARESPRFMTMADTGGRGTWEVMDTSLSIVLMEAMKAKTLAVRQLYSEHT